MSMIAKNLLAAIGAAAVVVVGARAASVACRIAELRREMEKESGDDECDCHEDYVLDVDDPEELVNEMDLDTVTELLEKLENMRAVCDSRKEKLEQGLEEMAGEKAKAEGKELFAVDDEAKMFHKVRCVNGAVAGTRREIATKEDLLAKGYIACPACFPAAE